MSSERFEDLRLLEALLFASREPMTPAQLARHFPDGTDIPKLLEELQALYANRGVNLVTLDKSWAFRTAPDLGGRMTIETSVQKKLSRAAIETLAIIAYHQPVTRAEIEEIRGVAMSKGTLDSLLEAGWIRPKGRRRTPGRPVTWATSEAFLDQFGLESLEALPGLDELKAAGLLDARPAVSIGRLGQLPPVDGENESAETAEEESEEALEEALDPAEMEEIVRQELGA